MRLLFNNQIDNPATVLTASSAAGTYPVGKLKDSLRKRRWRAMGSVEESVIVRLPPSLTISCFAITGHNLSDTATIEIQRSANGVTYVGVITIRITPTESGGFGEGGFGEGGFGGVNASVVLPGNTQAAFFTAVSSTTYPYWKIIIRDVDNIDNFVEVGRVYLGDYWEPPKQIVPNWKIDIIDESEITQLLSNQKINNEKDIYSQVSFQLPHLNPTNALGFFLPIIKTYDATKKDSFLVLFPDKSLFVRDVTTVYGRFISGDIGVTQIGMHTFDTGTVVFEESL